MTNNHNALLNRANIKEILEFYKKLRQENRKNKQKSK